MLAKIWSKGNFFALFVGMWIVAAKMEKSIGVLQRIKNRSNLWASNSISGYSSEDPEITNLKRYMDPYVHYNIIYDSQEMEAT